jgi:uncharacterized membrane protein
VLFRPVIPSLLALAALLVAACDGGRQNNDGSAPPVCTVEAPTACPDPPLHYPDIEQTIQLRCASCHWGAPGGEWPLLKYSHVADWQGAVRDYVATCQMPPPDSGATMSDEERVKILTWVLCGALE